MALSRYGDGDRMLGQAISSGGVQSFVAAMTPVDTSGNPTTGAAGNVYRLLSSAATDNATNATAAASTLRHIFGLSARTSTCYLKLYDKATAPASTDTPKLTIAIPSSSGFALDFPQGVSFTAGLGYRLTTGSADNDTGAVASGDILGLNLVAA